MKDARGPETVGPRRICQGVVHGCHVLGAWEGQLSLYDIFLVLVPRSLVFSLEYLIVNLPLSVSILSSTIFFLLFSLLFFLQCFHSCSWLSYLLLLLLRSSGLLVRSLECLKAALDTLLSISYC